MGAGSNPLVYGADLWGNKVEVFTNAGALTRTLGGSHPPTGGFNKPYGLALTATDMLVADTANHRVQRFTYAGKFLSSFGERGFGEDEGGERFWIYRAGDCEDPDTGSHKWFLHGIFA